MKTPFTAEDAEDAEKGREKGECLPQTIGDSLFSSATSASPAVD